jgi:HPt (histidine-containing phosphotransfer) domain-containing protein
MSLLTELVEIFRAESPRMMQDIRLAYRAGDAARLERAAHALRGSVGSLGARSVATSASVLESLARGGTLAGGDGLLRTLERDLDDLQRELDAFVARAGAPA